MTECNEVCREERSFSSDDTEFMDLPLPPVPVRAVEISNLDVHPSVAAYLYNRMEEFDEVPCQSSESCSSSPDEEEEEENTSTLNNNSKWSTSDEESSFYRERSSLFHHSEFSSPDRKKSNFLSISYVGFFQRFMY